MGRPVRAGGDVVGGDVPPRCAALGEGRAACRSTGARSAGPVYSQRPRPAWVPYESIRVIRRP